MKHLVGAEDHTPNSSFSAVKVINVQLEVMGAALRCKRNKEIRKHEIICECGLKKGTQKSKKTHDDYTLKEDG